jgi:hypothetical protein
MRYLFEKNCLIQIVNAVKDSEGLAKVISITAFVLSKSQDDDMVKFQEQMRKSQHYRNFLTHFVRCYEAQITEIQDLHDFDEFQLEHYDKQHESILTALEALCMSGYDKDNSFWIREDFQNDKAFAMINQEKTSSASPNVQMNDEAFDLFIQIMNFLHEKPKAIENSSNTNDKVLKTADSFRERIGCGYIRKLGRILVQNPYYYALAKVRAMFDVHVIIHKK